MRIIGKGREGFFVTATEAELMNVCGLRYYDRDVRSRQIGRRFDGFDLGDTIEVGQIFAMLLKVQEHESKLVQARAMLQAVISGVDLVQPIIREITAAAEPPATVPDNCPNLQG